MSHILVFPDHALVYFAIPKVANTSLRTWLAPLLGSERGKRYRNIHQQIAWPSLSGAEAALLDSGVFSFAITRDPTERLISAWRNKVCGRALHAPLAALGFTPHMPFPEFVSHACAISDADTDIHLRSQWTLLSHHGRLLPDLRVDMSRMDLVARTVRHWVRDRGSELGPIDHMNATGNIDLDALLDTIPTIRRRWVRGRLRDAIATRYRRDFELFGYEPVL